MFEWLYDDNKRPEKVLEWNSLFIQYNRGNICISFVFVNNIEHVFLFQSFLREEFHDENIDDGRRDFVLREDRFGCAVYFFEGRVRFVCDNVVVEFVYFVVWVWVADVQ
jgi:hypothetical protein